MATIFTTDKCPVCHTLIGMLEGTKLQHTLYRVVTEGAQTFQVDVTGKKSKMIQPVLRFPTIIMKDRNGNPTSIVGEDCISYIKHGAIVDEDLMCPFIKHKTCIGNKCSLWLKWLDNRTGIEYESCSIKAGNMALVRNAT